MNRQSTILSRNRQSPSLNQVLNRLLLIQQLLPTIIFLIVLILASIFVNLISIQREQVQIGQSIAVRVEDYLTSARYSQQSLVSMLSLVPNSGISDYLQASKSSQSYFESYLLLDKSGKLILVYPQKPNYSGLDMSNQPYFHTGASAGEYFISQPFISQATGNLTVYMTSVLEDGESLVGELSLYQLQRIVEDSIEKFPGSQVFITDEAGTLLAHPEYNLVIQETNLKTLDNINSALNLNQSQIQWINGSLSVGASTQLSQVSWRILSFASLADTLQDYLQISALIIFSVVIFSILFIRTLRSNFIDKVINPLSQLNQRIKTITRREGIFPDLLTEVDRPAFEEIGELARNFTQMSRAIMVRQSALSDSEQKYRTLIEQTDDAIFLIVNGTFELVNRQFTRWFNITHEDIIQKPFLCIMQYVSPASKERLYPLLATQENSDNSHKSFEIEMLHRPDSAFYVEVTATSFVYRNFRATQYVLRDITERKISEKAEHEQRMLAEALVDSASALNSTLNFDELMDRILNNLSKVVPYDASSIMLIDKEEKNAEVVASRGYENRSPEGWIQNFALPIASTANLRQMYQTGLPLAISDPLHDPNWITYPEAAWIRSNAGTPIRVKDSIIGFLSLDSAQENFYTPELANRLLAFADQAGLALNNAKMLRDLQKSNLELINAYNTTLQGWSKALELRDSETEGHTQRVLELSLKFGGLLGLQPEELTQLRYGVLLHDIGKIGIPDSILFKNGSLDDEEWKKMKMHPVFANQILSPIDYLKNAVDIPYCHHERWDGSGYPRGLRGREIPLSARIFSIVDVWDGLRSDRVYHSSWTEEEVVNYLRDQSGKMFDPELAERFINGILSGELL